MGEYKIFAKNVDGAKVQIASDSLMKNAKIKAVRALRSSPELRSFDEKNPLPKDNKPSSTKKEEESTPKKASSDMYDVAIETLQKEISEINFVRAKFPNLAKDKGLRKGVTEINFTIDTISANVVTLMVLKMLSEYFNAYSKAADVGAEKN